MNGNYIRFIGSPDPGVYDITKGDTGTLLEIEIGDTDGPIDLTGATVTFYWYDTGAVAQHAKVLTANADQVTYRGQASAYWGSTELNAVDAGNYPCNVKVVDSVDKILFAPSKSYRVLSVQEQLITGLDGVDGIGGGSEDSGSSSSTGLLFSEGSPEGVKMGPGICWDKDNDALYVNEETSLTGWQEILS